MPCLILCESAAFTFWKKLNWYLDLPVNSLQLFFFIQTILFYILYKAFQLNVSYRTLLWRSLVNQSNFVAFSGSRDGIDMFSCFLAVSTNLLCSAIFSRRTPSPKVINEIHWTNQKTRNVLSEAEYLIITDILMFKCLSNSFILHNRLSIWALYNIDIALFLQLDHMAAHV